MIAEILAVGTELLMGQVLNTNAQFIARRLAALGASHYHQSVVGDNPDRLEAALRLALSRADVVITTGGLGPTADDITKRISARLAGQPLVLRPEAEAMVRERFRQLGREMTENNLAQALFTQATQVLMNPRGTAPGGIVPIPWEGAVKQVIHLPGPPREMEPMFREAVEPWLRARAERRLFSRYIRIFGMGESAVDARLADLMAGSSPTLSPYCATGEVMLRATAAARDEEEAEALLQPLVDEILRRLGDVVYAVEEEDGGSLSRCAVEALRQRGWRCATCESLTGGLIAATLVEVPGASEVVRGGLVTYQTDTKALLAGVPEEIVAAHGVVSAETAMAMAEGTRRLLGVDVAVSATGLAGPGGGTPEQPVGTVYVGVATAEGVRAIPLRLSGDRGRIRTLAMKHAINALRREALGAARGE